MPIRAVPPAISTRAPTRSTNRPEAFETTKNTPAIGIRAMPAHAGCNMPARLPDQRHQEQHAIHAERHRRGRGQCAVEPAAAEQVQRHHGRVAAPPLDEQEQHQPRRAPRPARLRATVLPMRGLDAGQRQTDQRHGAADLSSRIELPACGIARFRHRAQSADRSRTAPSGTAIRNTLRQPRPVDQRATKRRADDKRQPVAGCPNSKRVVARRSSRHSTRMIASDAGSNSAAPAPAMARPAINTAYVGRSRAQHEPPVNTAAPDEEQPLACRTDPPAVRRSAAAPHRRGCRHRAPIAGSRQWHRRPARSHASPG